MTAQHLELAAHQLPQAAAELGVAQDKAAEAARYLVHYGHLAGALFAGAVAPFAAAAQLAAALAAFQEFAGLPVTGGLDGATLDKMREPRCGCPDYSRAVAGPQEARWNKRKLSYFIQDYLTTLSKADQDNLFELVAADWMAACDLEITRAASAAAADLLVSKGQGPQFGFDGPGGTLAWCYLPNGQDRQLLMRFDAQERFLRDLDPAGRGVLYRNVACHEAGHGWGLEHLRDSSALMAPFYSPQVEKPQPADVRAIQGLYGPPRLPPAPPQPVPPVVPRLRLVTLELDVVTNAARVVDVKAA
jgi:hypothetical protein